MARLDPATVAAGRIVFAVRSPTWKPEMTSTPCRSAAPDRIIAPWMVKIAELFAMIVETILMIGESFCSTLQDLRRPLPERRAVAPGAVSGAIPPHDIEARLSAAFGEHARCPCAQPLAQIRADRGKPEQRILKGYERGKVSKAKACIPPRKESVRLAPV